MFFLGNAGITCFCFEISKASLFRMQDKCHKISLEIFCNFDLNPSIKIIIIQVSGKALGKFDIISSLSEKEHPGFSFDFIVIHDRTFTGI